MQEYKREIIRLIRLIECEQTLRLIYIFVLGQMNTKM